MAERGLGSFIVSSPRDVAYLTGFLGGDSFLFIGPAGKPVIVSDGRYEEELEPFAARARIALRSGGMNAAVAKLVGLERDKRDLGAIGFQADHLTVAQADGLREGFKARRLPVSSLTATRGLVAGLRAIKDAEEIKAIRAAVAIQEAALEAALGRIGPGMTELEIAALLEYEMKARGSSEPGFPPIVAAGANGSLPHHRPGREKAARGSCLLIDWGATHAGYRGDMTRVFAFGRWPAELREIYAVVLEAHERAAAKLRPGVTTREVDDAARSFIAGRGYGECFNHGLGHGLGLDVHEGPRLSHMTEPEEVRPGQVYTIEPGVYVPGLGGVRIEDDYLVTERGRRNLCSLSRDIGWATL